MGSYVVLEIFGASKKLKNYTIPLKIKKKVQKINDFLHFSGLSDKT